MKSGSLDFPTTESTVDLHRVQTVAQIVACTVNVFFFLTPRGSVPLGSFPNTLSRSHSMGSDECSLDTKKYFSQSTWGDYTLWTRMASEEENHGTHHSGAVVSKSTD